MGLFARCGQLPSAPDGSLAPSSHPPWQGSSPLCQDSVVPVPMSTGAWPPAHQRPGQWHLQLPLLLMVRQWREHSHPGTAGAAPPTPHHKGNPVAAGTRRPTCCRKLLWLHSNAGLALASMGLSPHALPGQLQSVLRAGAPSCHWYLTQRGNPKEVSPHLHMGWLYSGPFPLPAQCVSASCSSARSSQHRRKGSLPPVRWSVLEHTVCLRAPREDSADCGPCSQTQRPGQGLPARVKPGTAQDPARAVTPPGAGEE